MQAKVHALLSKVNGVDHVVIDMYKGEATNKCQYFQKLYNNKQAPCQDLCLSTASNKIRKKRPMQTLFRLLIKGG
jgi:hypothetical protein